MNKAANTEPNNTNIIKTIFFLSCLEVSEGVEGDVVDIVIVTDGLEISINSNAANSVPLYVNTNDSFFIAPRSSLVKFLPWALLMTKRTSTDPHVTSRTMTSVLEIRKRCVSAAIKLNLKSSLSVMMLQLALNLIINVFVTTGEAVLGLEEDDSNVRWMLEGAGFVPV